jgi:hypothetical protein
MISLWGCLPVSSFLNQAFLIYSLTYLNPKPSREGHEEEFKEGSPKMAPGDSTSLWSLYFLPGENCLEGGGNSSQVSQNGDFFSGMSLYDNLRLGGILEG